MPTEPINDMTQEKENITATDSDKVEVKNGKQKIMPKSNVSSRRETSHMNIINDVKKPEKINNVAKDGQCKELGETQSSKSDELT
uniref:Uncharacterized protein n=1 Tax=Onchocerca volvulus TaxID=6282 RepID=A0A8R1TPQ9_ONCVO